MTNEKQDGGELVEVDFGAKEPSITRREREGFCQHGKVIIDDEANRVFCKTCGDEIAAIEFLKRLANRWRWYSSPAHALRNEAGGLRKEIADLKRQRRNLKAQVKRLKKKLDQ